MSECDVGLGITEVERIPGMEEVDPQTIKGSKRVSDERGARLRASCASSTRPSEVRGFGDSSGIEVGAREARTGKHAMCTRGT